MDEKELLKKVDHTLLRPDATWEEIRQLCQDAVTCQTASVCIPPAYVAQAKEYVKNTMHICTVIGFPNGYQTTAVKVAETLDAIENGADEIDMVIHLGWVKDKKWDALLNEIKEVKKACGSKILKVIIETCLLNEAEKIQMCRIVTEAGADYIKTSTGFSDGGATFEDVKLMKKYVSDTVRIKAAGGISTLEDAQTFLALGADRLGTSKVVKLIKEKNYDKVGGGISGTE